MAISVENTYPGRSNIGDANYPEGSIKNETVPDSSDDGTPLDELWGNDHEGLKQAILRSAGIVPTVPGNVPDTAIASQQIQGLIEMIQGRSVNYDESGAANAYVLDARTNQHSPASLFDGQIFKFTPGNVNTGASTANPVTLGAKNIFLNGAALTGGELAVGVAIEIAYNLASDRFDLISSLGKELKLESLVDLTNGGADDLTEYTVSNIPSWAKKVTLMLTGLSTSGGDDVNIQIGDSGGIETTGYLTGSGTTSTGGSNNATIDTDGWNINGATTVSTDIVHGDMIFRMMDATTNLWVGRGTFISSTGIATTCTVSGAKSLSAALTQLKISVAAGTIDGGDLAVMFE